MKTIASSILKFIIAAVLIVWMIYGGMLDLSSLVVLSDPLIFMSMALLVFCNITANNVRWTVLLRMQGFQFSAGQIFPLTLIGIFFNFATPGGVGGDLVKGYYLLKSSSGRKTMAATTLFFDRLMGFYGMTLVAAAVLIVNYQTTISSPVMHLLTLSVIGLFFLITVFFLFSFSGFIKKAGIVDMIFRKVPGGNALLKVYESIYNCRENPAALFKALILSLVSQFVVVCFVWFFSLITNAPAVSFSAYLFMVPLGTICMALPVAPAGIGVGQAAIYYLYRLYTGFDDPVGPNAFTAYQVMLFTWGLVGAFFYVLGEKRIAKKGC